MNKAGLKMVLIGMLVMILAAPAPAAEEVVRDGVLHVVNGAEPSDGNVTVELEEVWRHGGEDDDDFFGMISQCVVGENGTIYLLDTRMSEVPVYSPAGERLTTLSREGDGPGETRVPSGLLFMPDGNLGIVQVFPGRITKIGTDGTPAGLVEVGGDRTEGGFLLLFDCVSDGDKLVVSAEAIHQDGQSVQDRTNFVAAFDQEGNETIRFFENLNRWDLANFIFDEDVLYRVDYRLITVGRDGRVYMAPERNAYKINVYAADGRLERVIEREYTSRQRSEQDYKKFQEMLEAQFAQIPNAKVIASRTERDIAGLVFGTDGNLWVSTSRGGVDQPEGILRTWDVFTPDGHFIKTVSAKCEGDGANDILIWTPAGNAVMVTGFTEALEAFQSGGAGSEDEEEGEAAPMEVVYLRVAGN